MKTFRTIVAMSVVAVVMGEVLDIIEAFVVTAMTMMAPCNVGARMTITMVMSITLTVPVDPLLTLAIPSQHERIIISLAAANSIFYDIHLAMS